MFKKNEMKISQKHPKNVDFIYHLLNLSNIQKVIDIYEVLNLTKNIKGDIIECGVGRGRSLLIIEHLNFLLKIKKRILAFDSFQGFDHPTNLHDLSFRNPKKGEWSFSEDKKYKYTPSLIKKILQKSTSKIINTKVKFFRGFLNKSLKIHEKKINKISILHLDIDLYEPHLTSLRYLYNKLSKGGIILFDDIYKTKKKMPFPGAKKAFRDFFKNKSNYEIKFTNASKSMYIIKK